MHSKILQRSVLVTTLGFVAVAALVVGASLVGNSFRFTQQSLTIPGPDGDLSGVLTLPTGGTAHGLVVMVHGDGPVEATQDGLYAPWFEGAADADFATLSWSKPGVGGSDGNWLAQSMGDRAAEVSAVLDWAKKRDDVPTDTIVLWGASQAGWVLPKIINARADINAVVAVGPAINWLRQGRYNLLAELEHDGADAGERDQAVAESDRTRELLARGASYGEYVESATNAKPMTEERWGFVLRNFRADATDDLAAAANLRIQIHLMVGTHDRNVDVDETERTYRSLFGPRLTVERVDGAHSLAQTVMEDNDAVGLATGIVWPRALLAPGSIDDYSRFLSALGH